MTPINADEGIDLGTESKPQGSQRVFARFTSIRELVQITDDLAARCAALDADVRRLREVESLLVPRCARLEEQIVLLERRLHALEGGR